MVDTIVEYCVLNIAASPHPEGVYFKLLNSAARKIVGYYGDRYATISEPSEMKMARGIYIGRIHTWSEINKDEPAVDRQRLAEVDLNVAGVEIPDLGFNSRTFFYAFRVKDHSLFLECRNEQGRRLSPRQARKIFNYLFDPRVQGEDAPLVEVTVVPEEDALNRILRIAHLERLHIHLLRPNADDVDADDILAELEDMGARSQDITLTATKKSEGLKPNERTLAQANVGEHNGWVAGKGHEEDGSRIEFSTKEYPRIIPKTLQGIGSTIQAILSVARDTIIRAPGDQDT